MSTTYNGYEIIHKEEIEQMDSLKDFMKKYNKANTYNPGYLRIYKTDKGTHKILTHLVTKLNREKIEIHYSIETNIKMRNDLIEIAHIYGNRSLELFLNSIVKNKKVDTINIRYMETNHSDFTREKGVPSEYIEFQALNSDNTILFAIEINHIYNVRQNKMINPDRY